MLQQGGDSQNFLHKFVNFFVTLGLKILRLFSLKVLFEAAIINYCINHKVLFPMNNYSIKAPSSYKKYY